MTAEGMEDAKYSRCLSCRSSGALSVKSSKCVRILHPFKYMNFELDQGNPSKQQGSVSVGELAGDCISCKCLMGLTSPQQNLKKYHKVTS